MTALATIPGTSSWLRLAASTCPHQYAADTSPIRGSNWINQSPATKAAFFDIRSAHASEVIGMNLFLEVHYWEWDCHIFEPTQLPHFFAASDSLLEGLSLPWGLSLVSNSSLLKPYGLATGALSLFGGLRLGGLSLTASLVSKTYTAHAPIYYICVWT